MSLDSLVATTHVTTNQPNKIQQALSSQIFIHLFSSLFFFNSFTSLLSSLLSSLFFLLLLLQFLRGGPSSALSGWNAPSFGAKVAHHPVHKIPGDFFKFSLRGELNHQCCTTMQTDQFKVFITEHRVIHEMDMDRLWMDYRAYGRLSLFLLWLLWPVFQLQQPTCCCKRPEDEGPSELTGRGRGTRMYIRYSYITIRSQEDSQRFTRSQHVTT